MQSGITASEELQTAFRNLTQTPTHRGLLATIASEALIPLDPIPSTSPDLASDLSTLPSLLPSNEARYALLRTTPNSYIAVTWIPDACHVRHKTLFASTRLTLVRALGADHFEKSVLASTPDELTLKGLGLEDGAEMGGRDAMTEEERVNAELRDAEEEAKAHAADMSQGTGARKQVGGSGLNVNVGEGVREAMKGLVDGVEGSAVILKIDVPTETTHLDTTTTSTPTELAGLISDNEPRYTFFKHAGPEGNTLYLFIYTCPTTSKIKERMIYAATKRSIPVLAEEQGIELTARIEASDKEEINSALDEQFKPAPAAAQQKTGFSKPKRPGRR